MKDLAGLPGLDLGGSKAPSSMGKISTAGVPSAALGTGSSDCAPLSLCHAVNL